MFSFHTAGESHGRALVVIVNGVPAGFQIDLDAVNTDMARRQKGYGRGGRMAIERDRVQTISGIRNGVTIGSPVAFLIENRDWENWERYMSAEPGIEPGREVTKPRPGHADLVGGMKLGHRDLRNVLERSSARETAARTAAGGLAKEILRPFHVVFHSYVVDIGGIPIDCTGVSFEERSASAESSPFSTPVPDNDEKLKSLVDTAKKNGDTLGGIVEVVVEGLPPGLGESVRWDTRLDSRIAAALMSIPAIKGVEIGDGFELARRYGSEVHDEISRSDNGRYHRKTNHMGGMEGGMTNGMPLVVRAAMKPIPTLMKPLETVDIETKETVSAAAERSDVCAVPACAVVVEAMTAVMLTDAFLRQFGGVNRNDIEESCRRYMERVDSF